MRDNSKGMLEILAAYERDGDWFGAVRLPINGEEALEFWIGQAGYGALRIILQSKPFAVTPGVPHRYFLCHWWDWKHQ